MRIPFEQSSALSGLTSVRHGFFGRQGGFSTGYFSSLNVSENTGDRPALVARNRAQAAAALGFSPGSLAIARQIHSTTVIAVTDPPDNGERPVADAMVSNVPGILLGILTADCAPILFADPEAGVIGAAHAGWKGAVGGLIEATVVAMVDLGADPARIVAAIGPTISMANYEVGPEFAADLLARHEAAGSHIARPAGGREHFNLPGFVFDRLKDAGVGSIDNLGVCTYAEPDRYFSHRRATHEGTTTGRQIALIGLA